MKKLLALSLSMLLGLHINAKSISISQNPDSTYSPKTTTQISEGHEWTKRMALKIDLPKIISGSLPLSFEYSFNKRFSAELGGGYIYSQYPYSGVSDYGRINGFTMRGGVKFSIASKKRIQENEDIQLLQGLYLMPELMYSDYTITNGYNKPGPYIYRPIAITLNLGGQYILYNFIVIDWYIGIGTGGIGTQSFYGDYYYTHIGGDINFGSGGSTIIPLALTSGFKVGVIF